jgi:glycosyltransferase involved in cell wall biosynthesis
MGEALFISICIPAYQRGEYLKRLLDSIEIQNFRRFEVVITDDSPGMEVLDLVESHPLKPLIRYFKNPRTLGSPENWNEGLRQAKADWIKIMHDDDWFSGPDSLRFFAEAIEKGRGRFYFSAYTNVFPDGHSKTERVKASQLKTLKRLPEILIAANRVGPPSAVIFKKDDSIFFDPRMRWLVDFDFYIRYLKKHPFTEDGYIPKSLVQIGISGSQVTRLSFGNPEIEIPERFMLAEKLDPATIQNITVFDSWWRFIRNMKITDDQKIPQSGYLGKIPDVIQEIIKFQKHIPKALLNAGLFSKFFMGIHFFLLRRKK